MLSGTDSKAQESNDNDLILQDAQPFHSTFHSDILIAHKPFLFYLDVRNTFDTDIPVVASWEGTVKDENEQVIGTLEGKESIQIFPGDSRVFLKSGKFLFSYPEVLGSFCFEVMIHTPTVEEFDESNNLIQGCSPVYETKKLRVLFLPYYYSPISCDRMQSYYDDVRPYLQGTFPVAEEGDRKWVPVMSCIPFEGAGNAGDGEVLTELEIYGLNDDPTPHRDLVAYVWPGQAGGEVAYLTHPAVRVEEERIDITAQELAHTFGWVRTDNPLHCDSNSEEGHLCSDITAEGYWLEKHCEMGQFEPSDLFSCRESSVPRTFMSYGVESGDSEFPKWIDGYTWEQLAEGLRIGSVFDPQLIGIRGLVVNGIEQPLPWFRFEGVADIPLNNPGPFRIFYLDKQQEVIAETGFESLKPGIGGDSETELLYLNIPDVENTRKIIITDATGNINNVMFERVVSDSVPTLNVVETNGGNIYGPGEQVQVNWVSGDLDGDVLTYLLYLSDNGGEFWVPIARKEGVQIHTFVVPPNIKSCSVFVKIIATDGINTVEDSTAVPFCFSDYHTTTINMIPRTVDNKLSCKQITGTVEVALYSDATFNAAKVNPSTLKIQNISVKTIGKITLRDLDKDKDIDVLLQLSKSDLCQAISSIPLKQSSAIKLTGFTTDTTAFLGTDTIYVEKR